MYNSQCFLWFEHNYYLIRLYSTLKCETQRKISDNASASTKKERESITSQIYAFLSTKRFPSFNTRKYEIGSCMCGIKLTDSKYRQIFPQMYITWPDMIQRERLVDNMWTQQKLQEVEIVALILTFVLLNNCSLPSKL